MTPAQAGKVRVVAAADAEAMAPAVAPARPTLAVGRVNVRAADRKRIAT
jgi:hypothetical protein